LIGVLTQGGVPALLIVAAAIISGGSLSRRRWTRLRAGNLLGDQA